MDHPFVDKVCMKREKRIPLGSGIFISGLFPHWTFLTLSTVWEALVLDEWSLCLGRIASFYVVGLYRIRQLRSELFAEFGQYHFRMVVGLTLLNMFLVSSPQKHSEKWCNPAPQLISFLYGLFTWHNWYRPTLKGCFKEAKIMLWSTLNTPK